MKYRHRFRVRAPQSAVAVFHARPDSMAAITPPPIVVRVHAAPPILRSGDRMDFTLWIGPLPLHWIAQFESASNAGFTDRQLQGPFQQWAHRHAFRAIGGGSTEVRDEVNARLRRHVVWGPVGLALWAGMPLLFAYRGWKTRRLLAGKKPS
jgi:ligand-binding SRPBCC domain-containing protein